MIILALDPATKVGYASDKVSGVFDCKTKPDESKGLRLIRFKNNLKALIETINPTIICYEKPGGGNYNPLRIHSQLEGQIIIICEEEGIEYKGYSAKAIKKHATGNGNANKADMVIFARKHFTHINIIDDNHADALWLLSLAKQEYER